MADDLLIFVGSRNRSTATQAGRGSGLSIFGLNEGTLALSRIAETSETDNPSFVSVNADGSRIYVNSEVSRWREGMVEAYAFERSSGALRYLNKQSTLGNGPAFNFLTRDGSKLLVANYSIGRGGPDQSVTVFGIGDDGELSPPLDSVAHEGNGPNAARQERSHAHSVVETVFGNVAIVADLGTDSLVTYRTGADGLLEPLAETALKPGSGPRHVALHPNGKYAFVINELDCTIVSLSIDAVAGTFAFLDVMPCVPADKRENNTAGDIQVSPDGRFLYGSNRGHDSICIFGIDQDTGKLIPVGHVPCGGATPRGLCITPSGAHLLCANQNADKITIFQRDPESGLLADTGRTIETGTPMCIKILG